MEANLLESEAVVLIVFPLYPGPARHLFWLLVTAAIFHGAPSTGWRLVISCNGSVQENSCLPLFPGRNEKVPLLS
jgi:hypothetical protein